jgi:hypothetical protein
MNYNLSQHHQNSAAMKFQDHKTITWLIYELGYLNDAILRGDIIHFKNAKKLAEKHCDHAKKELARDGITDSFFMVSDFGGRIALSYEYKYPDGFAIKCQRTIPTGDIK